MKKLLTAALVLGMTAPALANKGGKGKVEERAKTERSAADLRAEGMRGVEAKIAKRLKPQQISAVEQSLSKMGQYGITAETAYYKTLLAEFTLKKVEQFIKDNVEGYKGVKEAIKNEADSEMQRDKSELFADVAEAKSQLETLAAGTRGEELRTFNSLIAMLDGLNLKSIMESNDKAVIADAKAYVKALKEQASRYGLTAAELREAVDKAYYEALNDGKSPKEADLQKIREKRERFCKQSLA